MDDEMIGIVKLFAGNFTPHGYMECLGQKMPIQSNQALYALLGTRFGGDANTYFNLPKLSAPENMKYIICVNGMFPSRD